MNTIQKITLRCDQLQPHSAFFNCTLRDETSEQSIRSALMPIETDRQRLETALATFSRAVLEAYDRKKDDPFQVKPLPQP